MSDIKKETEATEETVEKQVQAEPTVEEESLDAVVSDEAVESDKE